MHQVGRPGHTGILGLHGGLTVPVGAELSRSQPQDGEDAAPCPEGGLSHLRCALCWDPSLPALAQVIRYSKRGPLSPHKS